MRYYLKNRIQICKKTLGEYPYRSMARIMAQVPDVVKQMYERYPYEEYCDKIAKRILRNRGVYANSLAYQECCDAAITAYLYSMHRGAIASITSVRGYIYKMIGIYVNAALVIFDDSRNICTENNFRKVAIDDPNNSWMV